jgi:hypothetical protein
MVELSELRYAHIPEAAKHSVVADLDRVMTIDKALVTLGCRGALTS